MRVTSPQQKYLNDVFGLNDPELLRVREQMDKSEVEFKSVSGAEARILQFLIRGFGVKKIVEFGTLFGYSALAMAKALPADGVIVTLDNDPSVHARAQEILASAPAGKKVVSLLGDATQLMVSIESRGPFDMAFIDANKGGYVDYLNWAEKNVRPGGLIIGDNTFLWGALWGKSEDRSIGENQIRVMKEFNSRLADPAKYNSILVPTAEGLTVAQKLG